MSNLGEFLKARKATANRVPEETARAWQAAVEALTRRIHTVLDKYKSEGLTISERNVPLKTKGFKYSVPALTIHFEDFQIAVNPKAAPNNSGERGKVEMSCGANIVWLQWRGNDEWFYKWEYPQFEQGPLRLTDAAIEDLTQELLS